MDPQHAAIFGDEDEDVANIQTSTIPQVQLHKGSENCDSAEYFSQELNLAPIATSETLTDVESVFGNENYYDANGTSTPGANISSSSNGTPTPPPNPIENEEQFNIEKDDDDPNNQFPPPPPIEMILTSPEGTSTPAEVEENITGSVDDQDFSNENEEYSNGADDYSYNKDDENVDYYASNTNNTNDFKLPENFVPSDPLMAWEEAEEVSRNPTSYKPPPPVTHVYNDYDYDDEYNQNVQKQESEEIYEDENVEEPIKPQRPDKPPPPQQPPPRPVAPPTRPAPPTKPQQPSRPVPPPKTVVSSQSKKKFVSPKNFVRSLVETPEKREKREKKKIEKKEKKELAKEELSKFLGKNKKGAEPLANIHSTETETQSNESWKEFSEMQNRISSVVEKVKQSEPIDDKNDSSESEDEIGEENLDLNLNDDIPASSLIIQKAAPPPRPPFNSPFINRTPDNNSNIVQSPNSYVSTPDPDEYIGNSDSENERKTPVNIENDVDDDDDFDVRADDLSIPDVAPITDKGFDFAETVQTMSNDFIADFGQSSPTVNREIGLDGLPIEPELNFDIQETKQQPLEVQQPTQKPKEVQEISQSKDDKNIDDNSSTKSITCQSSISNPTSIAGDEKEKTEKSSVKKGSSTASSSVFEMSLQPLEPMTFEPLNLVADAIDKLTKKAEENKQRKGKSDFEDFELFDPISDKSKSKQESSVVPQEDIFSKINKIAQRRKSESSESIDSMVLPVRTNSTKRDPFGNIVSLNKDRKKSLSEMQYEKRQSFSETSSPVAWEKPIFMDKKVQEPYIDPVMQDPFEYIPLKPKPPTSVALTTNIQQKTMEPVEKLIPVTPEPKFEQTPIMSTQTISIENSKDVKIINEKSIHKVSSDNKNAENQNEKVIEEPPKVVNESKVEKSSMLTDFSFDFENAAKPITTGGDDVWGTTTSNTTTETMNLFENDAFTAVQSQSSFDPFQTIVDDEDDEDIAIQRPHQPIPQQQQQQEYQPHAYQRQEKETNEDDEEKSLKIEIVAKDMLKNEKISSVVVPLLPPPPKIERPPTPQTSESESESEQRLQEIDFGQLAPEIAVSSPDGTQQQTNNLEDLQRVFEPEQLLPLEPFYEPFKGDGWPMLIRMPLKKKKLSSNRVWKKCYVRLHKVKEVPTLSIYDTDKSLKPFHELAFQPSYQLCDIELQNFDEFGKCHTVKLQYVFYRERVGVHADRIAPTIGDMIRVKDLKGLKDLVHKPKATMLLDHHPQNSELIKLASLDYEIVKSFIRIVEDEMMKLKAIKPVPQAQPYTKDEITIDVLDEYYCELDKEHHIKNHKARVRGFCLAFLSGNPRCELGLNDLSRQGCEVVGRHDIIPIKTEEWIKIEQIEFHELVDVAEYEKDTVLKFRPMDAIQFELFRFRTRPRINKELPLQVRSSMKINDKTVEWKCEVMASQFWTTSRKAKQTPCKDISIRIPLPEPWIYLFRVEKRKWNLHQSMGSVHSTKRRTGKIKGLERITQLASSVLPPSLIEVTCGQAKYENLFKGLVWRIDQLPRFNEAAYKPHELRCRIDLQPHDIIPAEFDDIVFVEFNQPNSCVSRTQVRSIGVENPDNTDRWVHHMAKYEYTVEMNVEKNVESRGIIAKLGLVDMELAAEAARGDVDDDDDEEDENDNDGGEKVEVVDNSNKNENNTTIKQNEDGGNQVEHTQVTGEINNKIEQEKRQEPEIGDLVDFS